MTFFGEARSPVAAHESSPAMRWPLVVLAVPATLLGLVGLPSAWLPEWLAPVGEAAPGLREGAGVAQTELHVGLVTSVLSVGLAVVGALAVWLVWRRDRAADPTAALRWRPALEHAFYVDDLYDRLFVRPVRVAARAGAPDRRRRRGRRVAGTGRGARALAGLRAPDPGGNVSATSPACSPDVLLIVAGGRWC